MTEEIRETVTAEESVALPGEGTEAPEKAEAPAQMPLQTPEGGEMPPQPETGERGAENPGQFRENRESSLPAVAPERFEALAEFLGEVLGAEENLHSHYLQLRGQAESMAAEYPGFSLGEALGNETFVRLTSPEVGLSVEDAWWLVNRRSLTEEAIRRAAEETEQRLSAAVQAGQKRPAENGTGGPAAAARFDYGAMSPGERQAFLDYARRAAARGEKVYLY